MNCLDNCKGYYFLTYMRLDFPENGEGTLILNLSGGLFFQDVLKIVFNGRLAQYTIMIISSNGESR